ncbi:MAG: FmdB family zinc ribbon protein, partial [Methanothermobacter tenebrarum]
MPTYEFECGDCGERFEIRASIKEKEQGLSPKCPRCGSENTGQVFGGLVFFAKSGDVAFSKSS